MSTLFHGGVAGLWAGDVILPDHASHRFVDGCAFCKAQAEGKAVIDPATPAGWVYATTDRQYARYYASRAVRGSLYKVVLDGDVERSVEDPFPTWRARRATIIGVPELRVELTMRERRKLFVRWGGTPQEFDRIVRDMVRTARSAQP